MRCYSEKYHEKQSSYIGCSVCDDWKLYSKFDTWLNQHYIAGFQLDKDILIKDNKIYSPTTCVFVPNAINVLFTHNRITTSPYVTGVCWDKSVGKYRAQTMDENGKSEYLGLRDSEEKSYELYREKKGEIIKKRANQYKAQITTDTYNALLNWKVDTWQEACQRRDERLAKLKEVK